MATNSRLTSLATIVMFTVTACTTPSQPHPRTPLGEHLLGVWNLEGLDGSPIPGWVRSCALGYGCDSAYITSGELSFQAGAVCSRAYIYNIDQPPYVQRCTYNVNSNQGWLSVEGDPTRYEIDVYEDPATNDWSSDLTLWGPPCDPWAIVCHVYRADYGKSMR